MFIHIYKDRSHVPYQKCSFMIRSYSETMKKDQEIGVDPITGRAEHMSLPQPSCF